MSARLGFLLLFTHSQQLRPPARFVHLVYVPARAWTVRAAPGGAFLTPPELNEGLFCQARSGNNASCVVCNFLDASPAAADGAPFLPGAANGPFGDKRAHGPLLTLMTCPLALGSLRSAQIPFLVFLSLSAFLTTDNFDCLASGLDLAPVTAWKRQQLNELDSFRFLRDVRNRLLERMTQYCIAGRWSLCADPYSVPLGRPHMMLEVHLAQTDAPSASWSCGL